MKDTYSINSNDLRIENAKTILISLVNAFNDMQIEFYIIGALARDIMSIIHKENPIRATQDCNASSGNGISEFLYL